MTHFTNFPVVVCLAPFLITLGDGLSSTHWIVQDGAYFSPYAYSLSYQEDASCMDVCLRDPDCIGFYSRAFQKRSEYCRFAHTGSNLYFSGGQSTHAFFKGSWISNDNFGPARTGLDIQGSTLIVDYSQRQTIQEEGDLHAIEACKHSWNFIAYDKHDDSEPAWKLSWYGWTVDRTWYTPDGATDVGFTMDFGCVLRLYSLELKNIFYDTFSDRATKEFDVLVSEDNTNWQTWVDGATFATHGPTTNFPRTVVLWGNGQYRSRFLKFVLKDFYGVGGGLSHIVINYYWHMPNLKFV